METTGIPLLLTVHISDFSEGLIPPTGPPSMRTRTSTPRAFAATSDAPSEGLENSYILTKIVSDARFIASIKISLEQSGETKAVTDTFRNTPVVKRDCPIMRTRRSQIPFSR